MTKGGRLVSNMTMSLQTTVGAEVHLTNGEFLLQGQDSGQKKIVISIKIPMTSR
jgi:hypothetical protein